jgi:hypothetical protein
MAAMTFKRFPFIEYAGDGPTPSLEVELVGVNGHVESTLALVDSGTEWTMMSVELGRKLGVQLAWCQTTASQTAGGLVEGDLWWNDTPAGQAREEPVVRVMGHEVPIAPLLKKDLPIVALGRDFLATFKFCLDERESVFTLETYDEPLADWMRRRGR